MLKITFVVDGTPVPKGRPRFSLGHVYTPKRTREFEAKVRDAAKAAMRGRPATDMPVRVSIHAYREIPKSWSKKKQERARHGEIMPSSHGMDIDNVYKSVLDGMIGTVYTDDCQVVELAGVKAYSGYARTEVQVMEIV